MRHLILFLIPVLTSLYGVCQNDFEIWDPQDSIFVSYQDIQSMGEDGYKENIDRFEITYFVIEEHQIKKTKKDTVSGFYYTKGVFQISDSIQTGHKDVQLDNGLFVEKTFNYKDVFKVGRWKYFKQGEIVRVESYNSKGKLGNVSN